MLPAAPATAGSMGAGSLEAASDGASVCSVTSGSIMRAHLYVHAWKLFMVVCVGRRGGCDDEVVGGMASSGGVVG